MVWNVWAELIFLSTGNSRQDAHSSLDERSPCNEMFFWLKILDRKFMLLIRLIFDIEKCLNMFKPLDIWKMGVTNFEP